MKRQWQVHRTVKQSEDGQKRWDRVFLLILEIPQKVESNQAETKEEVNHASSDLCPGIDPESGARSND
jgi:hypothetical protein